MKTSKLIQLVKFNSPVALIDAIINSSPKLLTSSGFYYDYFLSHTQEYLDGYKQTVEFDLYHIPYKLKLSMVKALNLPREKGRLSGGKLDVLLSNYFYDCAAMRVGLIVQREKLAR